MLPRVVDALARQAEVGGGCRPDIVLVWNDVRADRPARNLAPLLRCGVHIGEPTPIEGIAIRATPSRPADRRCHRDGDALSTKGMVIMTIPSASTENGGKDEVRILDRGLEVVSGDAGGASGAR